jgi:hypothetical protein
MRRSAPLLVSLLVLCAAAGCRKSPPRTLCAGEPATKGPWVTRMGPQEATVFWESRSGGCAEVAVRPEESAGDGGEPAERLVEGEAHPSEVTAGYGPEVNFRPADETGTFYLHQVRVTELAEGACYRYRTSAAEPAEGRFCTARAPGQPIRFVALGDTSTRWGQAAQVVEQAISPPPDFVVHLGDLQYYSAILESWQSWFPVMAPLLRSAAFLPSVGNHEFEIPDEFPNYYARFFAEPGEGTTRWYTFSSGGVHFFSLDSESPMSPGSPQHTWLAEALARARATAGWRTSMAYFHKPAYSLGKHGPQLDLRAALTPLFAEHGVSLVLTAHVHGYERFEADGITWLVSGGGGAPLYDLNARVSDFPQDVPRRKAAAQVYQAVKVTVDDAIRGECVTLDGASCDSFVIPLP